MSTKMYLNKKVMSDDRFWKLVELANWPNCDDFDKMKMKYMKMLSEKECKLFRNTLSKKEGILYNLTEDMDDLGVSDDGYGDLIAHIVGLGKKEFEKHCNDKDLIRKRAHSREYVENYSYCIPYEFDYKEETYSIKSVIDVAKGARKEIAYFRKMDHNAELDDIKVLMDNIDKVMQYFLDNPNEKGLEFLIANKDGIERNSKVIDKFFEKNYMELPRKYTAPRKDGSDFHGMCTAIFCNAVYDAENALEFLKNE